MSETNQQAEQAISETENPFLPSRYVLRDLPMLAKQIETPELLKVLQEKFDLPGASVGDWFVVDDRNKPFSISNEDFMHFYAEDKGGKQPGKINIQLPGGQNGIGCKAVTLRGDTLGDLADKMNAWFEIPEHFGYMATYFGNIVEVPGGYEIFMLVTKTLSDRELMERSKVNQRVQEAIAAEQETADAKRTEAVAASTAEQRKQKEQAREDGKELAELRQHHKNCAGGLKKAAKAKK